MCNFDNQNVRTMKNKIKYYVLLLLVIISLILFFLKKDRLVIPIKENKTLQINPIIEKQSLSSLKRTYLYDNSKKAIDILPELIDEAQNNDASAAYRAVELSSICGLTNAAVNYKGIDDFLVSLGEAMLSDSSGRVFFNQLLTFPGISVDSFDEFSNVITSGLGYCEGYELEKDEYTKIFHLLNIAAKNGNAEAMVFLWNMSLPGYIKSKAKNFHDPNNLDYLKFSQENKSWRDIKVDYLFEAARAGEEKAWVLLGDVLSSDEWMLPDLAEAYKYYYAASKYYQFPFLINKLTVLENHLTIDEIRKGKTNGDNLYRQFN